jgi:hypothetical protein
MIAVADRIISVTFKPPNHKDRGTKRRHTKAWGDYFNKHVCHSKDSHVNGFIWSYSIIEGEGGQLCYLRKSPEDLADDWERMVQLLKNKGFVIERKEDGWHCRPALKCPNKFTIMIWRIRHAVDGFFRKPMETVEFRKRASPKQNNSSPSAAKTTGKEPSSYRDGSSADGGVPSVRGNLQIHSPYAASGPRYRRQTLPKQPPRTHEINNEGPQPSPFQGDLRDNGEVYRGVKLSNLSVPVSKPDTGDRNATQLAESDPGIVFGRIPGPHTRNTPNYWGGRHPSNVVVLQGCQVGGIYTT